VSQPDAVGASNQPRNLPQVRSATFQAHRCDAFSCAVASACFGADVESTARTLSMVASSVYHNSDSMDLDRGREQR
jgi:hypothetical protein